jgi:two-component system sensor histidine kinase and response regulator WspE
MVRASKVSRSEIQTLEGRPFFLLANQRLGLVTARQLLGYPPAGTAKDELSVVVLGERNARFGLVVDSFLGERELVVQALDKRLGKIQAVSAAAFMEDGSPVLIVDADELLGSAEKLTREGPPLQIQAGTGEIPRRSQKRILVVDDSLTVREMQRELLRELGYFAEVASDGAAAWAALRRGRFDLVITDVDMPRMDGIELTALIKRDARLKSVPVLIVSYKDQEENRMRCLDAGADYYLTKGSFHDKQLARAVMGLIGNAGS